MSLVINPRDVAPPFSRYAQGILSPEGCRWLHVPGQVGVQSPEPSHANSQDRSHPVYMGDPYEQSVESLCARTVPRNPSVDAVWKDSTARSSIVSRSFFMARSSSRGERRIHIETV